LRNCWKRSTLCCNTKRMKSITENPKRKGRVEKSRRDRVCRFSISLPESLFIQLNQMVEARGFESRSQAIAELIGQSIVEYREEMGNEVMAGTITLVYDHLKKDLERKLREIQYRYAKEIISSQHVHLENHHSLEVLLVQGPADRLKTIADELVTCKGVKHGKLNITSTLLPPLH
jgi:CopG family transcriptional regulator, nickel-responsive regulator